ncbi:YebC/PmpR family DNA-binding transcriptional regulator [Thalassoglobus polymorphus]|uniref:Probable transcriptional regulatory protein Mal48_32970 n=1 Tax=Thalassoglobus polymorphus TaxID=2527994 RepID=A0A517QR02_9PLAN|nr:YebC/PmpR family DNA-binding transcriptional regulator [Thalassoglobus polymorphus]QDT34038.1 putative transcriptional regulatory protein [Thalassoglobus polymorphus]
MAGHSHWANIAHKKGRIDKKRGALFGKLSRAIIVAARNGGGDPAMNLALRYALDKARKNSMPKDNIERAVKKGCGDLDGEDYQEIVYEGYGAGGVAVMAEALTENRNRTGGEIRKTFEVYGSGLGQSGCVSYMFERKGFFSIPVENITFDELFELALEAGADDVQEAGDVYEVTCSIDAFQSLNDVLEANNIETRVAELSQIPNSTVDLEIEDARKVLKLLEELEANEDIQSVTANFNIADDVMDALSEEE